MIIIVMIITIITITIMIITIMIMIKNGSTSCVLNSSILALAQALAKRLSQAEKDDDDDHHHHHGHRDHDNGHRDHDHHDENHLLRGGHPRTLNLRPEVDADPSSSSIAECLKSNLFEKHFSLSFD